MRLQFAREVDRSSGMGPSNPAAVTVIDGSQLCITPFRKAVVPPPMSMFQIQFQAPVVHVACAPPEHPMAMAALLSNGDLIICSQPAAGPSTVRHHDHQRKQKKKGKRKKK